MDGAVGEATTLKGQFKKLLDLQALDRLILGFEQERKELGAKAEGSKARVKASQARQAELKKAFEAQQKTRSLLELEVKARQESIRKYNGPLGELKSNEAYAAMLSEIKQCQDDITGLEEKILGLMENEEASRRKYEEDARSLVEETKREEAAQARDLASAKDFEDRASAENAKREGLLAGLHREFSEAYLKLLKPKKGMPVARILAGVCEGCSMKVPQHLINEIRKVKGIVVCQHCARILVFPEEAHPAA